MAKSQLLKRVKAQIMLDSKTETVSVRNLTFKDSEVFEVLSDQEDFERVEFVKRAIKVGTIALRDVFVAEKVEYVKREFEKMCFELDKVF